MYVSVFAYTSVQMARVRARTRNWAIDMFLPCNTFWQFRNYHLAEFFFVCCSSSSHHCIPHSLDPTSSRKRWIAYYHPTPSQTWHISHRCFLCFFFNFFFVFGSIYLGTVIHLVYGFCVEIAFSNSSNALDFFNFFTKLLTAFSDHLPSIDESSFPFFHANKRLTIGGVNGNMLTNQKFVIYFYEFMCLCVCVWPFYLATFVFYSNYLCFLFRCVASNIYCFVVVCLFILGLFLLLLLLLSMFLLLLFQLAIGWFAFAICLEMILDFYFSGPPQIVFCLSVYK